MEVYRALGLRPGITSVIGGGGKSTLLEVLAEELRPVGTVILATTTHMYPPNKIPTLYTADRREIAAALDKQGAICVGGTWREGKLRIPDLPIRQLKELADYVVLEADGARCLPLKAHMTYEPVIPPESGRTVCVVGLSGLGQPIRCAAHRAERYAALAGAGPDAPVTPELAARVLNAEQLCDIYLLNQTDIPGGVELARQLARRLNAPAVCGSLHRGDVQCLW